MVGIIEGCCRSMYILGKSVFCTYAVARAEGPVCSQLLCSPCARSNLEEKRRSEVTTTTASTESLLVTHRTEPWGQSWL